MLNYIRAEFYKVFRRKYTWITLAIVLALEALLVSGFVFTNAHGNDNSFLVGASVLAAMLSVGFCAVLLTGDMVFAGQYKHSTLKNEVSFGIPRSRIYLGKLIVQIVLSLLFCLVMVGFYLGLCYLTLYRNPVEDLTAIKLVLYCLAVALPLWIGVQALTCACMFLIKSELGAVFLSVGIFMVLPNVLYFIALLLNGSVSTPIADALMTAYAHMPTVMADTAKTVVGDWAYCGRAWMVGAGWCVISTVVGLVGFQRKEIK